MKNVLATLLLSTLALNSVISLAEDAKPIGVKAADKERAYAKSVALPAFTFNGIKIEQNRNRPYPEFFQRPENKLCLPFCVQPQKIDKSETIQLADFPSLADGINAGKILLLDLRSADYFTTGTLPGAIHFPYHKLFGAWVDKTMLRLVANKEVIVFCNGWYCNQSVTGIKTLRRIGYDGKIRYYRGGIQDWVDAGLPLIKPN